MKWLKTLNYGFPNVARTSEISTDQINELEMLKQFARFLIYIALQAAHLA